MPVLPTVRTLCYAMMHALRRDGRDAKFTNLSFSNWIRESRISRFPLEFGPPRGGTLGPRIMSKDDNLEAARGLSPLEAGRDGDDR